MRFIVFLFAGGEMRNGRLGGAERQEEEEVNGKRRGEEEERRRRRRGGVGLRWGVVGLG